MLQRLFCLLLVNFANAERVKDGERATKSHGSRSRSRDSSGAWGAWSTTRKRDSRGITEEEVILQELKELILEEDIGEVRRHESRRVNGGEEYGEQRERGGRKLVGEEAQLVKFERQSADGGELRCETSGFETRTRNVCEEKFETECKTIQIPKKRTEIEQQCRTKLDQRCQAITQEVPRQQCTNKLEERCETKYKTVKDVEYEEECHKEIQHICEKHVEIEIPYPVHVPYKAPYDPHYKPHNHHHHHHKHHHQNAW